MNLQMRGNLFQFLPRSISLVILCISFYCRLLFSFAFGTDEIIGRFTSFPNRFPLNVLLKMRWWFVSPTHTNTHIHRKEEEEKEMEWGKKETSTRCGGNL